MNDWENATYNVVFKKRSNHRADIRCVVANKWIEKFNSQSSKGFTACIMRCKSSIYY